MEYLIRGIARAGGVEVAPETRILQQVPAAARRRPRGRRLTRLVAGLLRGLGLRLLRLGEDLGRGEQALRAGHCGS